jgi:hypothetical protein
MANTISTETIVDDDFERERAELLKRAEEKPTLRTVNAKEAKSIEEWKRLYPEQALFIEVTKEDFSKVNAFANRRLHIDFKEGRVYIFPER